MLHKHRLHRWYCMVCFVVQEIHACHPWSSLKFTRQRKHRCHQSPSSLLNLSLSVIINQRCVKYCSWKVEKVGNIYLQINKSSISSSSWSLVNILSLLLFVNSIMTIGDILRQSQRCLWKRLWIAQNWTSHWCLCWVLSAHGKQWLVQPVHYDVSGRSRILTRGGI